jgi:hypothetical protein
MNKDIHIGSRVLLLPSSKHSNQMHTPSNPLSTYGRFCGEVEGEPGWYRVEWSNGHANQYAGDDSGLMVVCPDFDSVAIMDIFTRFIWDEFQISLCNYTIDKIRREIEVVG